ncbi:MucR family transcriptional regulator [Roseibacterium sp. SDUM158017]|uniref:MucR family transcriptional regulator n=1 Tax=Roseicyclus salinarum TaxID=3036773 RepID=UPI00241508DE|nr:MucR family transcriptional regulator [Roseibacterium sp. SDUM158017]MDG4648661.1 MucR family transcriptional regulator [Roseibacterium sp. SDUM158017]
MSDEENNKEMLVQIVSAYAARPDAGVEDIAALAKKLAEVFKVNDGPAGTDAGRAQPSSATSVLPAASTPVVAPDKAVTSDKVYCMCCGKGFKMLKRHIGAEHGLTEAQYRARFGLSDDFPLVAPNYSEMKARYAKKAGLGKYSRQAADAVE